MEVTGQFHKLVALPPGPHYPLERRMGRPPSQSGCGGKEKNSKLLAGIKPLSSSP